MFFSLLFLTDRKRSNQWAEEG